MRRWTPRPPRMVYLASQASLELGERRFRGFEAVRLTRPLEVTLEKKRGLLNEALDYYSRTVEFKVPDHITAATYQIGLLFEGFRDALLESERPGGLTAQQAEQYNLLLEEQAYPYEEKAIAAYEANVRLARREALYDEWIKKSYQQLAGLLPARYARPEMTEIVAKKLSF